MKKLLYAFSLLTFITSSIAFGQLTESRYDFEYETGATYTPLDASATTLPFPLDWDDEESDPITLPFDFYYQNVKIDNVIIETYGSIFLNSVLPEMYIGHITGLSMDYEARGRGLVKYKTEGTSGNQIFKIEYSNVGRYEDMVGNDTLNFQIWLYEGDNKIEYRTGFSNVPDSIFAEDFDALEGEYLLIGLFQNEGDSLAVSENNIYLQNILWNGTVAVDTFMALSVTEDNVPLFTKYPEEGTILRFTLSDTTTSVKIIKIDFASIYPNPAFDGIFQIQLKETSTSNTAFQVYDITGKLIKETSFSGQKYTLDLSNYAKGNYILKLRNDNKISTIKLTTL